MKKGRRKMDKDVSEKTTADILGETDEHCPFVRNLFRAQVGVKA